MHPVAAAGVRSGRTKVCTRSCKRMARHRARASTVTGSCAAAPCCIPQRQKHSHHLHNKRACSGSAKSQPFSTQPHVHTVELPPTTRRRHSLLGRRRDPACRLPRLHTRARMLTLQHWGHTRGPLASTLGPARAEDERGSGRTSSSVAFGFALHHLVNSAFARSCILCCCSKAAARTRTRQRPRRTPTAAP